MSRPEEADARRIELRRYALFAGAWLGLGIVGCLLVFRTVPDAFGFVVPGIVIGNRRWAWRGPSSYRLSGAGWAASVGYVLALVALGAWLRNMFVGFGQ